MDSSTYDSYEAMFRNNAIRLFGKTDGVVVSDDKPAGGSPAGQKYVQKTDDGWADPNEIKSHLVPIEIDSLDPIEHGGPTMYCDGGTAYINTSESHVMAIGSTGSRKTTSFIIPSIINIARSGEPMMIVDPKGELHRRTSGILAKLGYDIKVLNIWNPLKSDNWNPFLESYRKYRSSDPELRDLAIGEVKIIAECLCPIDNRNDPYWEESGRQVLTGLILTMYEMCDDPLDVNFRTLAAIKSEISVEDRGPVFRKFYKSLEDGSIIKGCLDVYLGNANNTGKCIISMVENVLFPICSRESITDLLSGDADAFSDFNEKTAYYVIAPDMTEVYNRIISLFTKALYCKLCNKASKTPDGRLPCKVNMVLDEFCNLNLDEILNMFTAARGRGIRIFTVVQSYSQLVEKYGDRKGEALLSQCDLIFLTSREMDLLRRLSEMVGEHNGRNLISSSELQRLEPGQALFLSGREKPYLCHLHSEREYPMADPIDLPEKRLGNHGVMSFSRRGEFRASKISYDASAGANKKKGSASKGGCGDDFIQLKDILLACIPEENAQTTPSDVIRALASATSCRTDYIDWIEGMAEDIMTYLPLLNRMGIDAVNTGVDPVTAVEISMEFPDYCGVSEDDSVYGIEYRYDGETFIFVLTDKIDDIRFIPDPFDDNEAITVTSAEHMIVIALILASCKHIVDNPEIYADHSDIIYSARGKKDFDGLMGAAFGVMEQIRKGGEE